MTIQLNTICRRPPQALLAVMLVAFALACGGKADNKRVYTPGYTNPNSNTDQAALAALLQAQNRDNGYNYNWQEQQQREQELARLARERAFQQQQPASGSRAVLGAACNGDDDCQSGNRCAQGICKAPIKGLCTKVEQCLDDNVVCQTLPNERGQSNAAAKCCVPPGYAATAVSDCCETDGSLVGGKCPLSANLSRVPLGNSNLLTVNSQSACGYGEVSGTDGKTTLLSCCNPNGATQPCAALKTQPVEQRRVGATGDQCICAKCGGPGQPCCLMADNRVGTPSCNDGASCLLTEDSTTIGTCPGGATPTAASSDKGGTSSAAPLGSDPIVEKCRAYPDCRACVKASNEACGWCAADDGGRGRCVPIRTDRHADSNSASSCGALPSTPTTTGTSTSAATATGYDPNNPRKFALFAMYCGDSSSSRTSSPISPVTRP